MRATQRVAVLSIVIAGGRYVTKQIGSGREGFYLGQRNAQAPAIETGERFTG